MDWIGHVALATLVVGLFAWLRADMGALRGEMVKQGQDLRGLIAEQGGELRGHMARQGDGLRGEIAALGTEVGKLRERMARMEGLLEGLREAVSSKHAA